MEDCKCERRLSDPLDPPSEETVKKAVDMLESYQKEFRELNRKSKLPIEVTEEHIKIIKRLMEEKKTKRMTKVEAFEYLKAKKVSVSDAEMNDRVQSKLFACGVQWKNGGTNVCYYSDYLVINPKGFLGHCDGMGEDYWNRLFHEEISVDDILSIEIVEEKSEEEEDTSMPTVEFERYVKILQAWSKRLNHSFVFSERGMGIVHGDLLTKLEGEEKGAYYKREATL